MAAAPGITERLNTGGRRVREEWGEEAGAQGGARRRRQPRGRPLTERGAEMAAGAWREWTAGTLTVHAVQGSTPPLVKYCTLRGTEGPRGLPMGCVGRAELNLYLRRLS